MVKIQSVADMLNQFITSDVWIYNIHAVDLNLVSV